MFEFSDCKIPKHFSLPLSYTLFAVSAFCVIYLCAKAAVREMDIKSNKTLQKLNYQSDLTDALHLDSLKIQFYFFYSLLLYLITLQLNCLDAEQIHSSNILYIIFESKYTFKCINQMFSSLLYNNIIYNICLYVT